MAADSSQRTATTSRQERSGAANREYPAFDASANEILAPSAAAAIKKVSGEPMPAVNDDPFLRSSGRLPMQLRYPVLAAALVGLLLPSLAMSGERYGGPGMMWDGGLFHMFFGFLMMILFLAIVVGVVVLLVRWLGGSELFRPTGQTSRTALDILKERLARGEIDVAEFEERKRALGD
jgi:putative membrane protein